MGCLGGVGGFGGSGDGVLREWSVSSGVLGEWTVKEGKCHGSGASEKWWSVGGGGVSGGVCVERQRNGVSWSVEGVEYQRCVCVCVCGV